MKKPRNSEELARAWKRGRLSVHTALKRHLKLIDIWPVDPAFLLFLPIILGFANMGAMDKLIPVGEEQRTVAQIIEDLQLQPFLNTAEEQP